MSIIQMDRRDKGGKTGRGHSTCKDVAMGRGMKLITRDVPGLFWEQSKLNWMLISSCKKYLIRVPQNIKLVRK